MQPGDDLGKITVLKYIDDVSDDDFVMYVFEDGTKCDEQYVAEINTDAFGKYFIVELTDALNKWTFNTKEYDLTETKLVTAMDGQQYEVPQPGISKTGEHISISTSETGSPLPRTLPFGGKRIESIPPKKYPNKKVEPKENYLLSLHPELADDNIRTETKEKPQILSNSIKRNTTTQEIDNTVIKQTPKQSNMNPIQTNIIETVKHASIIINLDDINSHKEYDTVKLITDGKEQELSITEFIQRLSNTQPVSTENNYDEDVLVKNLIDKSKKVECTIGIDLNLQLPPKEVYKTIKDIYSEELAAQFITSVANRINTTQLKEMMAMGLENYYSDN